MLSGGYTYKCCTSIYSSNDTISLSCHNILNLTKFTQTSSITSINEATFLLLRNNVCAKRKLYDLEHGPGSAGQLPVGK